MKRSLSLIIATCTLSTVAFGMQQKMIEMKKIHALGQALIDTVDQDLPQIHEIMAKTEKFLTSNPNKSKLFLKFLNTRDYYNRSTLILATIFSRKSLITTLIEEANKYLDGEQFDLFINACGYDGKTAIDVANFYAIDSYNLKAITDNNKILRLQTLKRQNAP